MEYAVGVVAAMAVGLFGTWIGFDKERSFVPVVLIVIAAYYILFATMAGSREALLGEALPVVLFVVAGLALPGVFNFFHHPALTNPGVPA